MVQFDNPNPDPLFPQKPGQSKRVASEKVGQGRGAGDAFK